MPIDKEKAKKVREGYVDATAGGKKESGGKAASILTGAFDKIKSAAEALGLGGDDAEEKKKKK